MKCYKPNTDQTCEVFISTGKKVYAEYAFPKSTDRKPKPNVFECFIPVSSDEQITINVQLSGTVLHGAADILADGAFVFDRRIEGDRKGKLKFQKRHWQIEEFYNVPYGLDADIMHTGQAVVAGSLFFKSLNEADIPLYVRNGGKLGLGSVAVIISINQDTEENYMQSYKHQTVGKWRDIRANHADGGIKPLHELQFRLEDDEVHFNRQQRHKRHGEQTRFGLKPWAMFVFYYRPQSAIQSTECMLRSTQPLPLEPFLGDFTFADPNEIIKKRLASRVQNQREKQLAAAGEDDDREDWKEKEGHHGSFGYDGNDSCSTAHSPIGSEHGASFIPPSPSRVPVDVAAREALDTSSGLQGHGSYASRKDSRISELEAPTFASQDPEPHGDRQNLFRDTAVADNAAVARPDDFGEMSYWHHISISGNEQGDGFDFGFDANLLRDEIAGDIEQAVSPGAFHAMQRCVIAPVAKMVQSPPPQDNAAMIRQPGPGDIIPSVEAPHQPQQHQPQRCNPQKAAAESDGERHAEPSALAQLVSSGVHYHVAESKAEKAARMEAKMSKEEWPLTLTKGKPGFDPTARTGYGYGKTKVTSKQSIAPTKDAMPQLDAQDRQTQGMLRNYLQDLNGAQQHFASPKFLLQRVPYTRPWENMQPTQPKKYPMSPAVRLTQPNICTQNTPAFTQPTEVTPVAAIPHKRSASVVPYESTVSNKKANNAARKAAMLAQLQEIHKARDVAEKDLEVQRQAREEMDRQREEEQRLARQAREAEQAELAVLEAELAGAVAEVEGIRELGRKEAEEARMKESERAREGEEGTF